jgi:hypothetical protein
MFAHVMFAVSMLGLSLYSLNEFESLQNDLLSPSSHKRQQHSSAAARRQQGLSWKAGMLLFNAVNLLLSL